MDYVLATSYYFAGLLISFYVVSLFHKHVDVFEEMTLDDLLFYIHETNDISDEVIYHINKKYIEKFHKYDSLIKLN